MRQDDFQLERKLQTKDWSIRVNTSILGMNDVDTYHLGKACEWWYDRNPTEFYSNLAEEMIDNGWTERRTQRNQAGQPKEYRVYIRNIVPRCTRPKKKRKTKILNGLKDTKFPEQSRYRVCRRKLYIFVAVAAITFVMINLDISV